MPGGRLRGLNFSQPSADDQDMTQPSGERPMLRLVLNEASGPASSRIQRALGLLLEELGMDVAFVGELEDGARVVTHAANATGATPVPVGLAHPVRETLCHLFINAEVGPIVADTASHRDLAGHPHTALFGVGARCCGSPRRIQLPVMCSNALPGHSLMDRRWSC